MVSLLSDKRPELCLEWDHHKNSGFRFLDVAEYSNKKYSWKCHFGHSWEASASNRSRGTGCPYCTNRLVCEDNCLLRVHPGVAAEWDYGGNGLLRPEHVLPGSNKAVWWRCSYGHRWRARVSARTGQKECCPRCRQIASSAPCLGQALSDTHPELCSEWSVDNKLLPTDVSYGSNQVVQWVCYKGHRWKTRVADRAQKGLNCPYCAGRRVCSDNCLQTLRPELASQWCHENVTSPSEVTIGSHRKAVWECSSGHRWSASVKDRVRGYGCPHCSGGSISKASQQWLDSLGVPAEHREYSLRLPGRKRPIRVDGFDPATNTVYEFLGDFWHGNPERFHPDEVNPVCGKTFGVLYRKTQARLESLRKAGYAIVFIWESSYGCKK